MRTDLEQADIRLGVASPPRRSLFHHGLPGQLPREGIDLAAACASPARDGGRRHGRVAECPADVTLDISERLNATACRGSARRQPAGPAADSGGRRAVRLPPKQTFDHLDRHELMEAECGAATASPSLDTWRARRKVPLRYQFRVPRRRLRRPLRLPLGGTRRHDPPSPPSFYLHARPPSTSSRPTSRLPGPAAWGILSSCSRPTERPLYLVKCRSNRGCSRNRRERLLRQGVDQGCADLPRLYRSALRTAPTGRDSPAPVRLRHHLRAFGACGTTFSPDTFANVWQEGERIGYTVPWRTRRRNPSRPAAVRSASRDGR